MRWLPLPLSGVICSPDRCEARPSEFGRAILFFTQHIEELFLTCTSKHFEVHSIFPCTIRDVFPMFMRQGGTHACHSQACASPESANRSGLTPLTYLLATYLLHAIDGLASPRLPRVLCIMHSPRFFVVGDTESESVPPKPTYLFGGRSG